MEVQENRKALKIIVAVESEMQLLDLLIKYDKYLEKRRKTEVKLENSDLF